MKPDNLTIHKLKKEDAIPFDLLLLADETREAIEKYIYGSDIYTVFKSGNLNPVGIFALYKLNDEQIEIKNIAVLELYQRKGIGSYMLKKIKEISGEENYKEIIVGTADSGINQIQFYERSGFKKYDIKKGFFVKNYANPIIENEIMLRDMVMLKWSI